MLTYPRMPFWFSKVLLEDRSCSSLVTMQSFFLKSKKNTLQLFDMYKHLLAHSSLVSAFWMVWLVVEVKEKIILLKSSCCIALIDNGKQIKRSKFKIIVSKGFLSVVFILSSFWWYLQMWTNLIMLTKEASSSSNMFWWEIINLNLILILNLIFVCSVNQIVQMTSEGQKSFLIYFNIFFK